MVTYKGYTASIKVDEDSKLLVGKVLDINDTVSFHGSTVDEAIQEFRKSVDSYLKFCEELGQKPDKPFSGKLPFRTTPGIHKAIYVASNKAGKSINSWMEEALKLALKSGFKDYKISKAVIDDERNIQALLKRVSNLLIDTSSLTKESFVDALEKLLIGLEEVGPFIQGGLKNENVLELIREIHFFLSEQETESKSGLSKSHSASPLLFGKSTGRVL